MVLGSPQQGNESVNTLHYCMITREKIKSQNNCYKLDMTCLCIASDYFPFSANSIKKCCFCGDVCAFSQHNVIGELFFFFFFTSNSTDYGPNPWHCCTTRSACRCKKHIFWLFCNLGCQRSCGTPAVQRQKKLD